jgi:hypothetical protein
MEVAFVSPGVLTDAGGFIIYIGSDGKVHIRRIPPLGPESVRELQAVFAILQYAGGIQNRAVADELVKVAQQVATPHAAELQKLVGG